jgi:hypothetical protein
MTTTLTRPDVELDESGAEPPTCRWEHYPRLSSPEPPEGCDADPVPGADFCARHMPDEDRW